MLEPKRVTRFMRANVSDGHTQCFDSRNHGEYRRRGELRVDDGVIGVIDVVQFNELGNSKQANAGRWIRQVLPVSAVKRASANRLANSVMIDSSIVQLLT